MGDCEYGCPSDRIGDKCRRCGCSKYCHGPSHPHMCNGDTLEDGGRKVCDCLGYLKPIDERDPYEVRAGFL